jgi:hypothetical protein
MIQGGQYFGFALESSKPFWIARHGIGQNFDRNLAIQLGIPMSEMGKSSSASATPFAPARVPSSAVAPATQ